MSARSERTIVPAAPALVGAPSPGAEGARRFLAVAVLAGLGFGMTAPLTVLYAAALGGGEAVAGFAVSSIAVSLLLVDFFGTTLVPRVDGRFAVWFALVVFGIGSLASAAAPSLAWMIMARVFQGVGAAFFMGGALHVVVRLSPPERSGRAIGAFNAAWFSGVAIGPLLGGVLASHGSTLAGYRIAFTVCGAICFAVAAVARAWLPSIPSLRRPALSLPRPARPRPGLRIAPPLVLACIGQAVRGGLVLTMIPWLGEHDLGLSTSTVGLALSVLAVVDIAAMRLGGALADRVGRRRVLVAALVSGAIACSLAPLVGPLAVFIVWCGASGVVVGTCWVVPAAVVVDVAEEQEAGLSMYRLSADVGQLVGATVAGTAVAVAGAARSIVFLGVGFALLTVWVGRMRETGHLTPPATAHEATIAARTSALHQAPPSLRARRGSWPGGGWGRGGRRGAR